MTGTNRSKITKSVDLLNRLGIKSEQITLCGSVALDYQGLLPNNRDTHDIDFLVDCDDKIWESVKLCERIFGKCDDIKNYKNDDHVMFEFHKIVLNIFKTIEPHSNLVDDITGIWVKPAGDIIRKKKGYGRLKDIKDINEICAKILG